MNSPRYPDVDESRDRLHRAGWSLGETCYGERWHVDGRIGENVILARGTSQAEAWYQATLQTRELGMLAASN